MQAGMDDEVCFFWNGVETGALYKGDQYFWLWWNLSAYWKISVWEESLKAEFAELYVLKEEFDKKYRNYYIWQVHKIVNEIKDLPVRFQ